MTLNCLSLNANGLGGAVNRKRRKLINYLHHTKANIIALQETHSTPECEKFWRAEWGGPVHFSHGSSSARGVALLVQNKFNGTIREVTRDSEGRYVIMSVDTEDNQYSFVSVYAPNEDKVEFFVEMFTKINEAAHDLKVIMGDFNTVLDLKKDLKGGRGHSNHKTREFLNEFMTENDLIDIWRLAHPEEFRATFER